MHECLFFNQLLGVDHLWQEAAGMKSDSDVDIFHRHHDTFNLPPRTSHLPSTKQMLLKHTGLFLSDGRNKTSPVRTCCTPGQFNGALKR
jgi:hypothetical protein